MTLPAWDFNGDAEKRRMFIAWATAELDRIAGLTTERFIPEYPAPDEWLVEAIAAGPKKRPVGKPPTEDAQKAAFPVQSAIWEYALLRWLFERHWPGKRRSVDDTAHPSQIAISRAYRGHHGVNPERRLELGRLRTEQAARLRDEYDRSAARSPGRRMAAADIAYLESLPGYLFTR